MTPRPIHSEPDLCDLLSRDRTIVPTPGMDSVALVRAAGDPTPWLAELRKAVMRPQLAGLADWDDEKQARRLASDYRAANLRLIEVNGRILGCIQIDPSPAEAAVKLFYLTPQEQGRGVGGAILGWVCWRADIDECDLRLTILNGARSHSLYRRHGFLDDGETDWEVRMVRRPAPHILRKQSRALSELSLAPN